MSQKDFTRYVSRLRIRERLNQIPQWDVEFNSVPTTRQKDSWGRKDDIEENKPIIFKWNDTKFLTGCIKEIEHKSNKIHSLSGYQWMGKGGDGMAGFDTLDKPFSMLGSISDLWSGEGTDPMNNKIDVVDGEGDAYGSGSNWDDFIVSLITSHGETLWWTLTNINKQIGMANYGDPVDTYIEEV